MTTTTPLEGPLHSVHTATGAKMADFSGWSMPLSYPEGGAIAEHTATREAVGVFDVSHLGKALVAGEGAAEWLNTILTNDVKRIEPGKAQYTMLCDDATGGVVDDMILYYKSDDEVLLVPNAANTAEVVRRMSEALPQGITMENQHKDYAVIAVQGPKSADVLKDLGLPTDHEYMSFAEADFNGKPVIVCRSGYTGEKGYELMPKWDDAEDIWNALLESAAKHGGRAAGLAARDTLRTEMGYALHGNELSLDITPNQGGTFWAVGWKKPEFWGKDALLKEKEDGVKYRMRGLLVEGRGIPRSGQTIKNSEGREIGRVTSGTHSPTRKVGIGLALIEPDEAPFDSEVVVDIRGKDVTAKVMKPPFVETHTSN